ncbi:hypothetical protein GCM10028807_14980 [Spirosoma daeguense]
MVTEAPKIRRTSGWTTAEKITFWSFFAYAILTAIPFNPSFYQQDFGKGFSTTDYPWRYLDVLSQNNPWFFSNADGKNYIGWLITLAGCFALGTIWTILDRNRRDYRVVTYWFYTLVRYSLALRMSWFAVAKVLPVQMPFPTISQLNTNLGNFTPGKLYWLTTGVSPVFEVFAGIFELVATVLVLFRATTTLGALMMVAILVPIWFVNIGYDAGVELTSLHILMLALILLARDRHRFYDLLIRHRPALIPEISPPHFQYNWQRVARITLKTGFILVFLLYRGYEYSRVYAAGKTFKLPMTEGVATFAGYYDVSSFAINHQQRPYSPLDSLRWQNVVFEKFNTISIERLQSRALNTENKARTTEYYGNVGRLYYGYEADTVHQILTLKNRVDTTQRITLLYKQPTPATFELAGLNESNDSLHITLTKLEKHYPLLDKKVSWIK